MFHALEVGHGVFPGANERHLTHLARGQSKYIWNLVKITLKMTSLSPQLTQCVKTTRLEHEVVLRVTKPIVIAMVMVMQSHMSSLG